MLSAADIVYSGRDTGQIRIEYPFDSRADIIAMNQVKDVTSRSGKSRLSGQKAVKEVMSVRAINPRKPEYIA